VSARIYLARVGRSDENKKGGETLLTPHTGNGSKDSNMEALVCIFILFELGKYGLFFF
jgi:hypothetical protein